MMGFGFLLMLLFILIPLVGIVVLAIWQYNVNRQGRSLSQNPSPEKQEQAGNSDKFQGKGVENERS